MSSSSLDQILASENMDASQYIKKSLEGDKKGTDDIRSLRDLRCRMQTMSVDHQKAIKKSISSNYKQFIDTARDISHLEGEMYQLSHMLNEQKTLIDTMQDISANSMGFIKGGIRQRRSATRLVSISGGRKAVQMLQERVEGVSHLVDSSDRHLLLEGDVVELNPDSLQPSRSVRIFLLNDGLLLTSIMSSRSEPIRYKLDSLFQLDNLAAVDVKDTNELKNTLKLLVFPEHRYFACDSLRTKTEWLDAIEQAKRRMLQEGSLVRQATIRNKRVAFASGANNDISLSALPLTPYAKPRDVNLFSDGSSGGVNGDLAETEWLRELPDELDVCAAQRDFDAAVELLFEGQEHLAECRDGPFVRQIRTKLALRRSHLVELLAKELCTSGSLQVIDHLECLEFPVLYSYMGGPKAARKAVALLVRLGRRSHACDLYLKSRSSLIKQTTRELRLAEEPLSYLRQLQSLVFGNLTHVTREFAGLFGSHPGCCSALLFWASGEMNTMIASVIRHVFEPGPSLAVLGQCVTSIFEHCTELADFGLDLTFEADKLMQPAVEKAIDANCRNFLDATRLRISEERWRPSNLQNEANLIRFVEEMADIGLKLDSFVIEREQPRCRLWVSSSVCHGARTSISVSKDLPAMRLTELKSKCHQCLLRLWRLQLSHTDDASRSVQNEQDQQVVERSTVFLITQVLQLCESIYVTRCGFELTAWTPLRNLVRLEYPALQRYLYVDPKFEEIGDV